MSGETLSSYCIGMQDTVSSAIAAVDRSGRVSIALIVNEQGRLLSTISDGDIRRGILQNISLDSPVSELLPIKARTPHPVPVTAPVGTDSATLLRMMQELSVRQIPLLDSEGRVKDVVILADLLPQVFAPLQAIVMAGGEGLRLRPLTNDVPKPMLPVGGKPLMEHIILKLRDTGIEKIDVATCYQSEKIKNYFGNGVAFGVSINYVDESKPLGTGGVLGLIEKPKHTVLVINGDILTDVDFKSMLLYHQEHRADLTVAVRRYEIQVPYGVVECEGTSIRKLKEKPQLPLLVNGGIYLLEPSVYDFIVPNESLNMTELISRLLASARNVVSFPIREYWLDIGQHDQYQQAMNDARDGKLKATRVLGKEEVE